MYVIFAIGMDPQGRTANCTHTKSAPTESLRTASRGHGFEVVQAWYSSSPYGPWTLLIVDPSAPYGTLGNLFNGTNPSPWVMPNGTVMVASHTGECLTLSQAPTWRGPYSVPVCVLPFSAYGRDALDYVFEDPFLWQDASTGVWQVLLHQYNVSDPHHQGPVGGYAASSSPDPYGPWTLQGIGAPVYTLTFPMVGGQEVTVSRRERPKLLLDSTTGAPRVLYTGVCPQGSDQVWTLAQPIH